MMAFTGSSGRNRTKPQIPHIGGRGSSDTPSLESRRWPLRAVPRGRGRYRGQRVESEGLTSAAGRDLPATVRGLRAVVRRGATVLGTRAEQRLPSVRSL